MTSIWLPNHAVSELPEHALFDAMQEQQSILEQIGSFELKDTFAITALQELRRTDTPAGPIIVMARLAVLESNLDQHGRELLRDYNVLGKMKPATYLRLKTSRNFSLTMDAHLLFASTTPDERHFTHSTVTIPINQVDRIEIA